jgi:hypothetical protein
MGDLGLALSLPSPRQLTIGPETGVVPEGAITSSGSTISQPSTWVGGGIVVTD